MANNKVVVSFKPGEAEALVPKLETVLHYVTYPDKHSFVEYADASSTVEDLIKKLKYYIKKANN